VAQQKIQREERNAQMAERLASHPCITSSSSIQHVHATIEVDGLSSDEARVRTDEETHQIRQVLWHAAMPDG
jgi:hypothetical protein